MDNKKTFQNIHNIRNNDKSFQYIQDLKTKLDTMKKEHKNDPVIMLKIYDLYYIALELELEKKLELNEKYFTELRKKS